jgi:redox-sensing transcriptional repressor
LVTEIKRILGTDRDWPVALIGIGNLGRALLGYRGFEQQGFRVAAAFDLDAAKVGQVIDAVRVYHLDDLPEVARDLGIKLGIIAVPSAAAQSVADRLAEAGVDGILNFAPVTISVPAGIGKVAVDLAIELEQLTFAVVNRRGNA